jgi:hypothetical protein
MHMEGGFMNKSWSQWSEGFHHILKHPTFLCFQISQQAKIITSLKKALLIFLLAAMKGFLKFVPLRPINLQICPHSRAKVTVKEKMLPIFYNLSREVDTCKYICDIPISTSWHVPRIHMIINCKPSKDFGTEKNLATTYTSARFIHKNVFEAVVVKHVGHVFSIFWDSFFPLLTYIDDLVIRWQNLKLLLANICAFILV